MKKILFVIAAIVTIGAAAFATSPSTTTDQAYDTWQPDPKMARSIGIDIR